MAAYRRIEVMGHPVRAIYEQGRLRLLDPVDLTEGQEIELVIVSERERAHAALHDLLVQHEPEDITDLDEVRLWAEVEQPMDGDGSVSRAIIEERYDGP